MEQLSSLSILPQESFWWWQSGDRYIISLFPPPPLYPLHLLLTVPNSITVSVDVKHHDYLLYFCVPSVISHTVSVDVKHHKRSTSDRDQERSRAGRWSWALIAGWIWIVLLLSCSSTAAFWTLSVWLFSPHSYVASHWRGPHLLNSVVLAVAAGLYRSERWDELLIGTRSPPFSVPNKPCGFCGRISTMKGRKKEATVLQHSGAVWRSRWLSWDPRPSVCPYGLCGR